MRQPPASVFVGVTGASGAPYAVRLVRALADAGCELSLCLSEAGVAVVAHELELGVSGRTEVTAAFLAAGGAQAHVFGPDDLAAPAASGSNFSFKKLSAAGFSNLAPLVEIITGSTTSGGRRPRRRTS